MQMNKHRQIFILTGITSLMAILAACGQNSDRTAGLVSSSSKSGSNSSPARLDQKQAATHPGKELAVKKCFFCHSPDAPEHGRIAPPMIAVKAHYLSRDTTKQEFTAALQDFVAKPTLEKAKMSGAVRRFGLMPYQPYNQSDINLIAEYLYDHQIEEPDWFKQHWQKGHGKHRSTYINTGKLDLEKTHKTPADIGLEYALGTKKLLGKNLMGTINSEGTLAALNFCNEMAYPLTAQKAQEYQATIKRVSDKPRNPANQANAEELGTIAHYKTQLAQGVEMEPVVVSDTEKHQFYYPITTNSMCLQCHGSKIEQAIKNSLDELYPEDKARGYDVGQVRGIWSVTFPVDVTSTTDRTE